MTKFYTAAAFALALMGGAAQAATITNGSFEDTTFTGSFQTLSAGSTGLNGWTVNGAGVDLINTYWQHAEGNYSLDLSAVGAGSVSQLITDLEIGQKYEISFAMAGNPVGGNGVKGLSASVGMAAFENFSFDTAGKSRGNMGWEDKSFTFTAAATTGLLTFQSSESNAFGPALDNVSISVAAVPLPASAMMLLAGLGGLGVMRRRKG